MKELILQILAGVWIVCFIAFVAMWVKFMYWIGCKIIDLENEKYKKTKTKNKAQSKSFDSKRS